MLYELQTALTTENKKISLTQLIESYGLDEKLLCYNRTEEDFEEPWQGNVWGAFFSLFILLMHLLFGRTVLSSLQAKLPSVKRSELIFQCLEYAWALSHWHFSMFRDSGYKICVFLSSWTFTHITRWLHFPCWIVQFFFFYIAENVTCRVEIHQSGQLDSGRNYCVETSPQEFLCDNRRYQLALSMWCRIEPQYRFFGLTCCLFYEMLNYFLVFVKLRIFRNELIYNVIAIKSLNEDRGLSVGIIIVKYNNWYCVVSCAKYMAA